MTSTARFDPKQAALMVAAASVAALAVAYGSQYFGGLVPCQLCLYQRPPYWIAAPAAGLAVVAPFPTARFVAMVVATLALLAGTAIAAYHVGVEQHWWGGLAGCSAPSGTAEEVEDIVRLLQGRELGRCSDISWSLFGLSMAAYNTVASAGLALLAGFAGYRFRYPRIERNGQ